MVGRELGLGFRVVYIYIYICIYIYIHIYSRVSSGHLKNRSIILEGLWYRSSLSPCQYMCLHYSRFYGGSTIIPITS